MITSTVKVIKDGINFNPTQSEFDTIPFLSHCSEEFARVNGGPFVNMVLDKLLPYPGVDSSKLKFHFMAQRFRKGSYSISPGWHIDWCTHFGNDQYENGINPSKRSVGLVWFGQDISKTEFVLGNLPDELLGVPGMDPDDFWVYRDTLVNNYIGKPGITTLLAEPGVVYELNPHSVHRPTAATDNGYRVLVKIEDSDYTPANRIIRSPTIFMPIETTKYYGNEDTHWAGEL